MAGTWPSYGCATEPKDHRGVVAYWAITPIRIDMEGSFGPYNYPPPQGRSPRATVHSGEQKNALSGYPVGSQATCLRFQGISQDLILSDLIALLEYLVGSQATCLRFQGTSQDLISSDLIALLGYPVESQATCLRFQGTPQGLISSDLNALSGYLVGSQAT